MYLWIVGIRLVGKSIDIFFFLFLHNFRSTNLFIFYPLIFLLYSFIKMSRSIREMIFLLPFLHQEETHSFSSAVTRTLVSRATTRAKLHRSFFTRINLEKIPYLREVYHESWINLSYTKRRRRGRILLLVRTIVCNTFLRTAINGWSYLNGSLGQEFWKLSFSS